MALIYRLVSAAVLFSSVLVSAAPIHSSTETSSLVNYKRGEANVITKCTVPGTLAITFDDGPYKYTEGLLDILKKKNAKATFFMNGQNYDSIFTYKSLVQRAKKEGHQIGSHTWDHADLSSLTTKDSILDKMKRLDDAIKKIIGVRPVYMRPPYGNKNDLVVRTLTAAGYKVVIWDVDSGDSQGKTPSQSLEIYKKTLSPAGENKKPGHIILQHDVYDKTVHGFISDAIDFAHSKGFKLVTVGECLGQSPSTWYRS
ncbi:Carbohydrate esterase 4 protein [Entomortierella chlamydospora]|uniref:Carbohydrate esterase 4 protein n=1 Tax=Entomortierella chlamydospora TaxID=101097 RepID=A0A9P6MQM6_9FUNG|nr:Carbohydrate esterase 4 protein [Entomortierella chlamydospora]KAG0010169.1 Carbohydrate esterase 4 protein [Entomortierella chlamydospora]